MKVILSIDNKRESVWDLSGPLFTKTKYLEAIKHENYIITVWICFSRHAVGNLLLIASDECCRFRNVRGFGN